MTDIAFYSLGTTCIAQLALNHCGIFAPNTPFSFAQYDDPKYFELAKRMIDNDFADIKEETIFESFVRHNPCKSFENIEGYQITHLFDKLKPNDAWEKMNKRKQNSIDLLNGKTPIKKVCLFQCFIKPLSSDTKKKAYVCSVEFIKFVEWMSNKYPNVQIKGLLLHSIDRPDITFPHIPNIVIDAIGLCHFPILPLATGTDGLQSRAYLVTFNKHFERAKLLFN